MFVNGLGRQKAVLSQFIPKSTFSFLSYSMRRFLVAYNVGWAQGEGSSQWRFKSNPINEHLSKGEKIGWFTCIVLFLFIWFSFFSCPSVYLLVHPPFGLWKTSVLGALCVCSCLRRGPGFWREVGRPCPVPPRPQRNIVTRHHSFLLALPLSFVIWWSSFSTNNSMPTSILISIIILIIIPTCNCQDILRLDWALGLFWRWCGLAGFWRWNEKRRENRWLLELRTKPETRRDERDLNGCSKSRLDLEIRGSS